MSPGDSGFRRPPENRGHEGVIAYRVAKERGEVEVRNPSESLRTRIRRAQPVTVEENDTRGDVGIREDEARNHPGPQGVSHQDRVGQVTRPQEFIELRDQRGGGVRSLALGVAGAFEVIRFHVRRARQDSSPRCFQ